MNPYTFFISAILLGFGIGAAGGKRTASLQPPPLRAGACQKAVCPQCRGTASPVAYEQRDGVYVNGTNKKFKIERYTWKCTCGHVWRGSVVAE